MPRHASSLEASSTSDAAVDANHQVRLKERNVVELINKLQQLGLLGDDLLHTVNGREYVTTEHLRKEVLEAVETAGRRIALVMAVSSSACPIQATSQLIMPGAFHACTDGCSAIDMHGLLLGRKTIS